MLKLPVKIIWASNDYGWAIYDAETKQLVEWHLDGDDISQLFTRLGCEITYAKLPEFDGEAPANILQ